MAQLGGAKASGQESRLPASRLIPSKSDKNSDMELCGTRGTDDYSSTSLPHTQPSSVQRGLNFQIVDLDEEGGFSASSF